MSSLSWHDDPKRMVFLLSRYKFAAKMLCGLDSVLEVGMADGFGSRIVRQAVKRLTACDFDPIFVKNARENVSPKWPIEFIQHDMLAGPVPHNSQTIKPRTFDAAYAIDVFEHIKPGDADRFVRNIALSLEPHGVCLIGMPSLESQVHASEQSRIGHVNCQSGEQLRETMRRHFRNVFIFGMNDEVVHTGFSAMAHYLWALCVNKRE